MIADHSLPATVAMLAVVSVSLLVWTFLSARTVSRERARRLEKFGQLTAGKASTMRGAEEEMQREARELHTRNRAAKRTGPRLLLKQAGIDMTPWAFLPILAAFSISIGGLLFLWGLSPLTSGLAGIGLGIGVLMLFVRRRRKKRMIAMERDFPGALDIIVRGVKSGLPLNDCLRIASHDIRDPLGSEFRKLVEQQSLGMPVGEAVTRFADRVPLQEASFFAIVIALQTRTGGRLAESLDNLVSVLRARVQLRAKIRSMSSEAKASAMIIGALPPVVATLVYLTSPDYIGLLFSELIGQVVLVGSAIWMLIGVLVMKKMIAFDY